MKATYLALAGPNLHLVTTLTFKYSLTILPYLTLLSFQLHRYVIVIYDLIN